MAVQFWLRERRHDSGALVPSGEGPHRFDVRATANDAVCLRSRPRQARIPTGTQVQVLMFKFVNIVEKNIRESSKGFNFFLRQTYNITIHTNALDFLITQFS